VTNRGREINRPSEWGRRPIPRPSRAGLKRNRWGKELRGWL